LISLVDTQFWRGKRVFLTGHTGFKGSWLSLWLQSMGAIVKGYALAPPTRPALYEEANVAESMESDFGDVRDLNMLSTSIISFRPEILIHMAAQPLVRLSYKEPVDTYSTNVMGTVNVLEAARHSSTLRAIVNVTTDKCYENKEWFWGYREDEPMGGHDPYSNSKGCAELVTSAFRSSYFSQSGGPSLASARAGNVIGGGDWADDRLIPDILRAFEAREPVIIRNPLATRPWQHVLEPLSGYLILAQKLFTNDQKFAGGWNFGPRDQDVKTVESILEYMVSKWGEDASWQLDKDAQPHEARLLKLDTSKANSLLGWQPKWSLEFALDLIVDWQLHWLAGSDVRAKTLEQIEQYQSQH
jgi:CDP-glucose 4,6-dehydratase